MAQPHTESDGADTLMSCEVCRVCPQLATCTPLLVGGEVIGSVLVAHEKELADQAMQRVRESVRQAAPVLANLRNLAVAQLRASTDALTGLSNRRSLETTLRRMVAQALRMNSPLAALMLDLDHFKQINDQYGHGRGDEVLAAVGVVLRDTVRQSDFAGRYGGEEFLILLPDTDEEGARVIAEKIRSVLAEIVVTGLDRRVTASVGVAILPVHALDAEALVQESDRALYVAKSNGRDRVEVIATDRPPSAVPAKWSAKQEPPASNVG